MVELERAFGFCRKRQLLLAIEAAAPEFAEHLAAVDAVVIGGKLQIQAAVLRGFPVLIRDPRLILNAVVHHFAGLAFALIARLARCVAREQLNRLHCITKQAALVQLGLGHIVVVQHDKMTGFDDFVLDFVIQLVVEELGFAAALVDEAADRTSDGKVPPNVAQLGGDEVFACRCQTLKVLVEHIPHPLHMIRTLLPGFPYFGIASASCH